MNIALILISAGIGALFLVLSLVMLARLREHKPKLAKKSDSSVFENPGNSPRAVESRQDVGDFTVSAALSAATHSPLLGSAIGGSFTGALIGSALADTATDAVQESSHDVSSHEASSHDVSSHDASSHDVGGGGGDSDSFSHSDW